MQVALSKHSQAIAFFDKEFVNSDLRLMTSARVFCAKVLLAFARS